MTALPPESRFPHSTGNVPRALGILAAQRRQGAPPAAVAALRTYLQDREAWIPNDRARRRARLYIGSGLGEQANDRIVARRQKRRGMQWGARSGLVHKTVALAHKT